MAIYQNGCWQTERNSLKNQHGISNPQQWCNHKIWAHSYWNYCLHLMTVFRNQNRTFVNSFRPEGFWWIHKQLKVFQTKKTTTQLCWYHNELLRLQKEFQHCVLFKSQVLRIMLPQLKTFRFTQQSSEKRFWQNSTRLYLLKMWCVCHKNVHTTESVIK